MPWPLNLSASTTKVEAADIRVSEQVLATPFVTIITHLQDITVSSINPF